MGIVDEAAGEIRRSLAAGELISGAPMGEHTSFKAGGKADYLALPATEGELLAALAAAAGLGAPFFVMGNGTNLLVRDGGYRGIVIRLGGALGGVRVDGRQVAARAGAPMAAVAQAAAAASLTGLEFAGGIPGSVGGAVYMNAGAYGGEVSRALKSARVAYIDGRTKGARVENEGPDSLRMSYRRSALRDTGGIVLEAVFSLEAGDMGGIRARMDELSAARAEKQPLGLPSAGSFFKRPEGHFAGKLIRDAGLCGMAVGGAEVSALHAGFIVNRGGATASDITRLMELVQREVYGRFGVALEPEVEIIGDV
jgi:UDP-N-acetylmuramate dehydrogenase